MKNLLPLAAGFLLLTATGAKPVGTEQVEVEISNPCNRTISYGYNAHYLNADYNVDAYGTVDAGKSKKVLVPKGTYLKFSRKNAGCVTMLGRADYKGQRFTMDCQ